MDFVISVFLSSCLLDIIVGNIKARVNLLQSLCKYLGGDFTFTDLDCTRSLMKLF